MLRLIYLVLHIIIFQVAQAKPHRLEDSFPIPNITTPWGNYKGKLYGPNQDYYIIPNIRYGKAPVGQLRFAAPQYPDAIRDPSQVQDNTFAPNCIQAKVNANVSDTPAPNGTVTSEDCLFLDIYVPEWALELGPGANEIPIVVWLYGGAYIFGGKNTTLKLPDGNYSAYDGAGIREMSNNNIIWVVGNYRMGAYGFSAGTSIEKNGQPNAGLLDQRLILDFVQKYIDQVNGDKTQVSLWGLSAGAGSILHHLTAYGGDTKKNPPLFNHAVLWSTAFQWSYDRSGTLETTFQNFSAASLCRKASDAVSCLRNQAMDDPNMKDANQRIVNDSIALGMFPFGPAVDGDLVPELPASLLKKGKHIPLDSITLVHDVDEASLFVAKWVKTPEDFTKFLNLAFPGAALSQIRQDIEKKYPTEDDDKDWFEFAIQRQRIRRVLRDSTFVCNKYQAVQAYSKTKTKIYAMRYDIIPLHGSDLAHIIWSEQIQVQDFLKLVISPVYHFIVDILSHFWVYLSRTYQNYFSSLAVYGNPNAATPRHATHWQEAKLTSEGLANTLNVRFLGSSLFHTTTDPQVSADNCDFWDDVAAKLSSLMNKDVTLDDVSDALVAQIPELR